MSAVSNAPNSVPAPSSAELQDRMSSLMRQLEGIVTQIRSGASPDADVVRMLPPGFQLDGRDNSPPLDPETWMTTMMRSLNTAGAAVAGEEQQQQQQAAALPKTPVVVAASSGAANEKMAFPHQRLSSTQHPNAFPLPDYTGVHDRPPVQHASHAAGVDSSNSSSGGRGDRQGFIPNHMAEPFVPRRGNEYYSGGGSRGGAPRRRGGHSGGGGRGQHADQTRVPPSGFDAAPGVKSLVTECFGFVEFKRQRIKKFPCLPDITPGQYVIVDGDRGQDCGLLVQVTTTWPDGHLQLQSMDGSNIPHGHRMRVESGRVLRIANTSEIDHLHNEIACRERSALKTCRQRCQELDLGIDVIDCEYQFDLKKVSFYFDSDRSVDFRDLVRDLYRTFGARIWMENINPNVKNVVPGGRRGGRQGGGAAADEAAHDTLPSEF